MNLYSLLIGIGASLGLMQVARRAPQEQELPWASAGLIILAAALAGARLNYVLLHPYLFAGKPGLAASFWLGGLAWPGALAAALLAFFLIALVWGQPLGKLADGLYPLLPPLVIMVWVGCSQAGCAYGSPLTEDFPWALPVIDERGLETYRWPLPFMAALVLLLLVWRVERLALARTPGLYACTGGLVLALHTALFSLLRDDPLPYWQGLRLDLAASALLGGLCLLGLLVMALLRLRAAFSDEAPGANRETWFSPKD